MWITLQTNFDEVIKCKGDNTYKIRHLNKKKLERLGQLPTVIEVSQEAQAIMEDDSDDDFSVDSEMEVILENVEEEYRSKGYVPPPVITADELEELLADAEQPLENAIVEFTNMPNAEAD
jgi:hypothetical protein